MLDLLKHLVPKFSDMFSSNPNSISAWFWLVTALIFIFSLFSLVVNYRRFLLRIQAVRFLLSDQKKETLVQARRATLQKSREIRVPGISLLWREFDEGLVISSDRSQLLSPLGAETFFNAQTLAAGLTASRLLAAAPSFLVAVGVLGTFVGLTVGLEGLVGASNEVEALKAGINKLISGAAVAFMTSVWGVLFSLLLNFIEKMFERSALSGIQRLQHEIDALYLPVLAEQSLVHIAEYGKESKEALQELHERIGERFQEAIGGVSEAMQAALVDAINGVMAPAIQTLVKTVDQQSNQVLDQLIRHFMDGMVTAGREQGENMQQAAANVNAAVNDMGDNLNKLFSRLSDQYHEQAEMSKQRGAEFESQLEKISHLATERQIQMEQRFSEFMTFLSSQLNDQLGAASQRDAERQSSFENLLIQYNSNQENILDQSSRVNRQQIQSIVDASNAQSNQLETVFSRLMVGINEQFKSQIGAAEEREELRQQYFQEQSNQFILQQQNLLSDLTEIIKNNQHHSQSMAQQQQNLLDKFKLVTDAAVQSSKHMDSTANQLGLLSANVRSASELLGQHLKQVAVHIEHASEQSSEVASRLQQQAEILSELQHALLSGAQHLEEAANEASCGFSGMKATQQEFLLNLRAEFNALGNELRNQVQAIEEQAESWLRSYSDEVKIQTNERMNQWNEVSLKYADQMLSTAQYLSSILDELESR